MMRQLALDNARTLYYQSIISMMQWMCKIGCIDITMEVLFLSLHLAYPRKGHLDAALYVMGYLKMKYNL
jgi:hypothetical protein